MKKQFGCFVALFVFLIVALPVMAQSDQMVVVAPQMQNVTGQVGDSFNLPIGNQTVGGQLGGSSYSSFDATGLNSASGTAKATGDGNGSQTVTPNSVLSVSSTKVDSIVFTQNDGATKIAVEGGPAQSTWGSLGDPKAYNFSGGYETGSALYNGTQTGTGPLSGAGAGFANGQTLATMQQGPNAAQATVQTVANSGANLTMPGSTSAAAYGIVAGQSMVGVPTAFGEADMMGTAKSNTVGGSSALSSIAINGQTNVLRGPSSVSASAVLTAQASGLGTGTPVTNPPSCGCGH